MRPTQKLDASPNGRDAGSLEPNLEFGGEHFAPAGFGLILLRCQVAVDEREAAGSIMPTITAVERELAQSFDFRDSDRYPCQKRLEKAVAEIEAPPDLEDADFVKGRFLGISVEQRHTLPSVRNLQLLIEGRSYRVVAIEESGAFIAVKEA